MMSRQQRSTYPPSQDGHQISIVMRTGPWGSLTQGPVQGQGMQLLVAQIFLKGLCPLEM